jgi:hypothetical protein
VPHQQTCETSPAPTDPKCNLINGRQQRKNKCPVFSSGAASQRVCYAMPCCRPHLRPETFPAPIPHPQWSMDFKTSSYPQPLCRRCAQTSWPASHVMQPSSRPQYGNAGLRKRDGRHCSLTFCSGYVSNDRSSQHTSTFTAGCKQGTGGPLCMLPHLHMRVFWRGPGSMFGWKEVCRLGKFKRRAS